MTKSLAKKFSRRQVSKVLFNKLDQVNKVIADLNKHGKLHGIDQIVNKNYHPLERLLWLSLVVAAFYGVFYIGYNQMERFSANPTVISLERGKLHFMISKRFLKLNLPSVIVVTR